MISPSLYRDITVGHIEMINTELFKVMGGSTHRRLVQVLNLQVGWVAGLDLNTRSLSKSVSSQGYLYLEAGIDVFCKVAVRLPDRQKRTTKTLGVLCQHPDPWIVVNGDAGIVNVNPPQQSAWRIPVPSVATEDLVSRDIRHVEAPHVLGPEVIHKKGFQTVLQQYP